MLNLYLPKHSPQFHWKQPKKKSEEQFECVMTVPPEPITLYAETVHVGLEHFLHCTNSPPYNS